MSEAEAIKNSNRLNTRYTLAVDLKQLGLYAGMTVMVHSSLSRIGWVCGGPVAVIQALMDVVTEKGTIVMPAHSGEYSDPSLWGNPPVPREWWEDIRRTMPAFEEAITPTRGMGAICETFRKFPGVKRSSHPALSFCAWGSNAAYITQNHSLDYSLGEKSPLARIYDLDGWILLLGVDYDRNTSLHLAEYRAEGYKEEKFGAPIIENEQRVWKEYTDIEFDSDVFKALGIDFEKKNEILKGNIGMAHSKLMKQRVVADYATQWIGQRRNS